MIGCLVKKPPEAMYSRRRGAHPFGGGIRVRGAAESRRSRSQRISAVVQGDAIAAFIQQQIASSSLEVEDEVCCTSERRRWNVQRAVSFGTKDIGNRPTRFPIGIIVSGELRECHAEATAEFVVGQVSDGPHANRDRHHVAWPAVGAWAG